MAKYTIFQPYEFNDASMLAENLLLYDQLVVWLSQVTNLANSLGIRNFERALESGAFRFVDTNAHVIPEYTTIPKDQAIAESFSGAEINLVILLQREYSTLSQRDATKVANEILSKCRKLVTYFEAGDANLNDSVLQATDHDARVLEIPQYLSDLAMNAAFTRQRLFTINLELALLHDLGAKSFVSTPDLMILHASKFHRQNLLGHESEDVTTPDRDRPFLIDLLSIQGIPDVGNLINSTELTFSEILDIRLSNDSSLFRKWFHQFIDKNEDRGGGPKEIIEAYCESLKINPLSDGFAVKSLRLATSAALGLLNPLLGLASSAADTFLLNKLTKGWKPSYFLHERLFATLAPHIYGQNISRSSQAEMSAQSSKNSSPDVSRKNYEILSSILASTYANQLNVFEESERAMEVTDSDYDKVQLEFYSLNAFALYLEIAHQFGQPEGEQVFYDFVSTLLSSYGYRDPFQGLTARFEIYKLAWGEDPSFSVDKTRAVGAKAAELCLVAGQITEEKTDQITEQFFRYFEFWSGQLNDMKLSYTQS